MKAEGTYLEKILARTAADLPARKKAKSPTVLEAYAKGAPKPAGFEAALGAGGGARIIAEIKRRSPSQGDIDRDLDAPVIAREYEQGGAAAISVLTDSPFFAGTIEDLARTKNVTKVPLLRKDFIIDPYQLMEARVAGASAALLIVAALDGPKLFELMKAARELRLECLVEVHDDAELDRALDAGATLIGINNRDLRQFTVDLAVTERLAPRAIRSGSVVVAESGIKTADDVRRLAAAGAKGFLVGESLVRAGDRTQAVRELVAALP